MSVTYILPAAKWSLQKQNKEKISRVGYTTMQYFQLFFGENSCRQDTVYRGDSLSYDTSSSLVHIVDYDNNFGGKSSFS